MTMDETRAVYDDLVVPESRNIPRSSTKDDGAIVFDQQHAPLLFIAGQKGISMTHNCITFAYNNFAIQSI